MGEGTSEPVSKGKGKARASTPVCTFSICSMGNYLQNFKNAQPEPEPEPMDTDAGERLSKPIDKGKGKARAARPVCTLSICSMRIYLYSFLQCTAVARANGYGH